MPRRKESSSEEVPSRLRPATTPDAREAQMIELADQLAERQLREGTASAQVITHYLKLGSSRERLEQEKIGLEQQLLKAKADQISSQARQDEMFARAIAAFRTYRGDSTTPEALSDEEYRQEEFDD